MAEGKSPLISSAPAAKRRASPPQPPAAPPAPSSFEHDAALTLAELQRSVAALLDSVSEDMRTVVEVEKAFGIDHKLGWQLYRIVRARTPLAAAASIPARVSMERLLKSAARRRVPADIVGRVSEAFGSFDRLVLAHAQDRAEFDAMVRALLPEERHKQQLASKQAVFAGTSQIRGVAIETFIQARFLYPSRDGRHIDSITLGAEIGLRRLNPIARIGFGTMPLSATPFNQRTLDGRPADGPTAFLLPQFCSKPLPRFETVEIEGAVHYWVVGNDIGLRSALDLVWAYRAEARWPRVREPGGKHHVGVHEVIDVPAARFAFDVFAHRNLFGDARPELAVYQTIAHGVVRTIGDPAREDDRLHLGDAVHALPGGLAGAGLGHAPEYIHMLEHACRHTGFEPDDFRGFRVDSPHPFYGAQYSIRFPIPD